MPSCRTRFSDAVGGDEMSVKQLGVGDVQVIKDHASCSSRYSDAVGGDEISVEQLGVGDVQVIKDHALRLD
jgi:hypothetical protein